MTTLANFVHELVGSIAQGCRALDGLGMLVNQGSIVVQH
jgi:shikimate 5-dehydrogenase